MRDEEIGAWCYNNGFPIMSYLNLHRPDHPHEHFLNHIELNLWIHNM